MGKVPISDSNPVVLHTISTFFRQFPVLELRKNLLDTLNGNPPSALKKGQRGRPSIGHTNK